MKKSLVLALAVLATTAFAATPAKKDKKTKKTANVEQAAPVRLISQSDSLSYAAGKYTTRGLMDYVKQQFGVDSTNIQEFVAGIQEGITRKNDKQFNAHSAGLQIAQMLESRIYPNVSRDVNDTPVTLDSTTFNRGFIDAILGDTTVMQQAEASKYFEGTMRGLKKQAEEAYKAENEAWLKENAKKPGVVSLPSGLQYKILTEGKGTVATKDDEVTVRYAGHTIDGKEFDSSYKRNPNTTSFRPEGVIKGWTEALCMMPEGSKWELYIPQNLAYGSRQAGSIKPYSTLVFEVEVVKVEKKADKPATDKAGAKADKSTVKAGAKTNSLLSKLTTAKKTSKKVLPGSKK